MNSNQQIPRNLSILSNSTPQYDFEFCDQQATIISYPFNYSYDQTAEYSFFYSLSNEIYHIKCEEINNNHNNLNNNSFQYDNVYHFDYVQSDTKRLYRFTCRNLSSTFIFQFLNKSTYGIEFTQDKQLPMKNMKDQKILESSLKRDLTCYLALDQDCKKNYYLDLMFVEDYQNYLGLSKSSNVYENTKSSKKKSCRCTWDENSVKLLLSFLVKRKRQHGGKKIKTKLWDDAVTMLSEKGYKYTAKQCSIKWKNIKQNYNDDNNQNDNNPIEIRYKSKIEEILNGETMLNLVDSDKLADREGAIIT
uniref:Myb/SANT-like DNA-binding domain-containing protein n=1 Tax=Rhizophagus irregularis (strain DAOM 181602 / DAOM 197198 / MUCL 43194) TaxID=747089 RepID=U9SZZ6_RHIID